MLAHNAAVLRIGFDSHRLFTGDSPDYMLWLGSVVKMVNATNQKAAREAEASAR